MGQFKELSSLEKEILRLLEYKKLPSISKGNESFSPNTDIRIWFGLGDKEVENEWRAPLLKLVLNNLSVDEIESIIAKNDGLKA